MEDGSGLVVGLDVEIGEVRLELAVQPAGCIAVAVGHVNPHSGAVEVFAVGVDRDGLLKYGEPLRKAVDLVGESAARVEHTSAEPLAERFGPAVGRAVEEVAGVSVDGFAHRAWSDVGAPGPLRFGECVLDLPEVNVDQDGVDAVQLAVARDQGVFVQTARTRRPLWSFPTAFQKRSLALLAGVSGHSISTAVPAVAPSRWTA